MTKEQLAYKLEDGARIDVVADNFWGRDKQRAFFDVRVFNPFASSYRNTTLSQCYRRNELEKKETIYNYDERIQEIEHGSFSPLVFSTAGGDSQCGLQTISINDRRQTPESIATVRR